MQDFNELYNELMVEYSIPKQFTSAVTDIDINTIKDEKNNQIKMDKFKTMMKKLTGSTRRGKCARDLHDKKIQDRDNDVQTTAVEVEESKNEKI